MKKVPLLDALTALGVILSLVFVGLEIRGNTRAVRGTTLQGITDQSIALNMALISVPELRSAYAKAMSGKIMQLSVEEEDALTSWYGALLRVAENRFRQRQLGTYDNVRAAGGIATGYRSPFFRAYWEKRRSTYPADFARYVDQTLLPLVSDSVPRILPR